MATIAGLYIESMACNNGKPENHSERQEEGKPLWREEIGEWLPVFITGFAENPIVTYGPVIWLVGFIRDNK